MIDADTTALITYGSPEGAEAGYIPKQRHRQRSDAPIISSEGRSGLSLGMQLRSGNVPASSGAWSFLQTILEKVPSSIASTRTRVRLDGAFYDKAIVHPLEAQHVGYVIVARMTRRLQKKMLQARYEEFAQGWEPGADSTSPMALLLRSGIPRIAVARNKRILCHGPDSHPRLLG